MSVKHHATWLPAVLAALAASLACAANAAEARSPVRVVTSIFPLYDFARAVAGERAEISLLLPPGADVHTWQPRPSDIVSLSRADLVIIIGSGLEPWAETLLMSRRDFRERVLEAGSGLTDPGHTQGDEHETEHDHEAFDPHLWLDFQEAQLMVRRIRDALAALAPSEAGFFEANARSAVENLRRLDEEFREGLGRCRTRTIVLGGHAAFGRLAARYGLKQVSLYGLSPDAEPTARRLTEVVSLMRREGLSCVFYEENTSRKLAEVLARETGATLIGLDPGGNPKMSPSSGEFTFLGLMRRNLSALRRGLGCE